MEYYHIYNRGAHKAPIFLDISDYTRFLYLLYVKNDSEAHKFFESNMASVFSTVRTSPLIDIIAYCLMPNHFHVVIAERAKNSISKFMHKLCTSYAMYYNAKYDHSGTIFQGPYKAKHVDSDDYLRYLIQYVHLNPFGIKEPDMNKLSKTEHLQDAIAYSETYEFSSYKDYLGEARVQRAILTSILPGEA